MGRTWHSEQLMLDRAHELQSVGWYPSVVTPRRVVMNNNKFHGHRKFVVCQVQLDGTMRLHMRKRNHVEQVTRFRKADSLESMSQQITEFFDEG